MSDPVEEMWIEEFANKGHCGLCGNSGIVDTTFTAITAAGVSSGGKFHCICPNGRQARKRGFAIAIRTENHLPESPNNRFLKEHKYITSGKLGVMCAMTNPAKPIGLDVLVDGKPIASITLDEARRMIGSLMDYLFAYAAPRI